MKKILFTMLCLATCVLGVRAAEGHNMAAEDETVNGLIIEQKDGSSVGFLFADEPVMTYTETDIVLNGVDFSVSYPIVDVARMVFGDASAFVSGIKSVDEKKVGVAYSAEGVTVTGVAPGEMVAMFTVDGKTVCRAKADGDGMALLKGDMQRGVAYVVKAGKLAFKIIARH